MHPAGRPDRRLHGLRLHEGAGHHRPSGGGLQICSRHRVSEQLSRVTLRILVCGCVVMITVAVCITTTGRTTTPPSRAPTSPPSPTTLPSLAAGAVLLSTSSVTYHRTQRAGQHRRGGGAGHGDHGAHAGDVTRDT